MLFEVYLRVMAQFRRSSGTLPRTKGKARGAAKKKRRKNVLSFFVLLCPCLQVFVMLNLLVALIIDQYGEVKRRMGEDGQSIVQRLNEAYLDFKWSRIALALQVIIQERRMRNAISLPLHLPVSLKYTPKECGFLGIVVALVTACFCEDLCPGLHLFGFICFFCSQPWRKYHKSLQFSRKSKTRDAAEPCGGKPKS